jgi:hypothetical protein
MKLQRVGYTEGTLLFCNYLTDTIGIEKQLIDPIEKHFVNWLYSCCGWYDKNISGSYFDINYNQVYQSSNYKNFLETYRKSIENSDHLIFLLHDGYFNNYLNYKPNFISNLKCNFFPQYSGYWFHSEQIYHLLTNKNVLVISSFDELINQQYNSGNVYKIFQDFPRMKNLSTINFPYCFFNNGPHKNSFETIEYIMSQIDKIEFDIALVGAGPNAAIIVDKIFQAGKSAMTMCSGITKMFGIDPGAEPKEYWITTIPPKYIPQNFDKIENGRYWIGGKK